MRLSEKELKHLERLKKSQRYIHKMRYVFLFLGILLIILSFGIFFLILSLPDKSLYERSASLPVLYLLSMGAGGVSFGYAYQGWRGNSVYTLLIRVIEELKSKQDRNDST